MLPHGHTGLICHLSVSRQKKEKKKVQHVPAFFLDLLVSRLLLAKTTYTKTQAGPISMGNPMHISPRAENVKPKRMTPLSHFKAFSRKFSSGTEPRMESKMNSVQGGPQVHRAFIALGSNVGDRIEMIEKACLELDKANIKVKRTSSLFETTPMYVLEQATFINGVCEVRYLYLFAFDYIDNFLMVDRLKLPLGPWSFWILFSLLRMPWAERS